MDHVPPETFTLPTLPAFGAYARWEALEAPG